jgi:hypothetical protein
MFSDFGAWVTAVLKKYWAWLPSSAVAALLSIVAGAKGWNWPNWTYYALAALGFLYSFFQVWRDEYVANRNAPQLTVDWVSSAKVAQYDVVTIRNTGNAPTVLVRFDDFSDETISWHRRPEIQTLPGEEFITFTPEFSVATGPNSHELGYMRYVLAKRPTSLSLRWSDTNGTSFRRLLTLSLTDDKRTIRVDYGPISATRKKFASKDKS